MNRFWFHVVKQDSFCLSPRDNILQAEMMKQCFPTLIFGSVCLKFLGCYIEYVAVHLNEVCWSRDRGHEWGQIWCGGKTALLWLKCFWIGTVGCTTAQAVWCLFSLCCLKAAFYSLALRDDFIFHNPLMCCVDNHSYLSYSSQVWTLLLSPFLIFLAVSFWSWNKF